MSDLARAQALLWDLVGTDDWEWTSVGKVLGEATAKNIPHGAVWGALSELGMVSVRDHGRDWIGYG